MKLNIRSLGTQWRCLYLLLSGVALVLPRFHSTISEALERTRFPPGGLLPGLCLALRENIMFTLVPSAALCGLFVLSFWWKRLNTAAAAATVVTVLYVLTIWFAILCLMVICFEI
jgi:hypothetical protein